MEAVTVLALGSLFGLALGVLGVIAVVTHAFGYLVLAGVRTSARGLEFKFMMAD